MLVKKHRVTHVKVNLKDTDASKKFKDKLTKKGVDWKDKDTKYTYISIKYKFKDYEQDNEELSTIIVADKNMKVADYESHILEQLAIFETNLRDEQITKLRDTLPPEQWEMVQPSEEYESQ